MGCLRPLQSSTFKIIVVFTALLETLRQKTLGILCLCAKWTYRSGLSALLIYVVMAQFDYIVATANGT